MQSDRTAVDRRTVLRASAALVGGATLSTLAGCLDGNGAGGTADGTDTDEPDDDTDTAYAVEHVADGFEHPWGLAVLPGDGRLLVTERPGRLSLVDPADGTVQRVEDPPEVDASGQGGLLDVAIHPDFPDDRRVYLSYAARGGEAGTTTHLGSARLDAEAPALEGFETLLVATPSVDSSNHFGSRVTFGPEGALFVTVGDRRDTAFGPDHVSQDRSNELGATLRLTAGGDPHPENPFLDDPDAADTVYSYGHRNPQAMAVRPETGAIWQCEHGEEDGDEINVVERGGNYGWPIVSEACRYGTDDPVAPGHETREDVVAPVHHWACGSGGFPPSGAVFYEGSAFPAWQGDLLAGTLAGEYLGRFSVDGTGPEGATVTERAPLLADRGWRVRALTIGPDGLPYVAVDDADAPIVRFTPA